MLPDLGSLVYYDGNRAGIVIGHELDDVTGEQTGGLILGTFGSAIVVEPGNYGSSVSAKAENAPSFVPDGGATSAPAAPVAAATAGDLDVAAAAKGDGNSTGTVEVADEPVWGGNAESGS